MTKLTPETYTAVPKATPIWRYVLWTSVPFSAIALLLYGCLSLISVISVPSFQVFHGSLQPNSDPIVLSLPVASALDEVLVNRGDHVKSGQTIALLDQQVMEEQMSRLKESVLSDVLFRNCLVNFLAHRPEADGKILAWHIPQESSEPTQLGHLQCATFRKPFLSKLADLSAQKQVLEDQLKLFDQYLRVLTETKANETRVESKQRMLRAVVLNLARNRLREKMIALDAEASTVSQDASDQSLQKIEETNAELEQQRSRLQLLSRYNEEPRILAPEAGQIRRIRATPKGVFVQEKTEFVELWPSNQSGYIAQFTVPEHLANTIHAGTAVVLQFTGTPVTVSKIHGVVDQLEIAPNGTFIAQIQLNTESIAWLDSPQAGIAFSGRATALRILVKKSDDNALAALVRRLKSTLFARQTVAFAYRLSASLPAGSGTMQN